MLDKKIPLVELFGPTIQGEGAMIGVQTYFIRTGLCDYKCKMCDSMHAVDPSEVKKRAKWLTQWEIFTELYNMLPPSLDGPNWVTLSGGNPCIHDLSQLVEELHRTGMKVAVETQGTMWQDWVNDCDHVTVSPKAPGMGETLEWDKLDDFIKRWVDRDFGQVMNSMCLKMPVFSQIDLDMARAVRERYPDIDFYLSMGNPYPPDAEGNPPISTAELLPILTEQYKALLEDIYMCPVLSKVRFLPQWHIYLFGQDKGR